MRNIPPIHLIVAFDAVARLQSFTAASQELHLSNSAISHRIRELEQILKTTLFHRTTRNVTLSPEGAYLHHQVRASLASLETAFSNLTLERDVVRISALPSFARFRLLPALTNFHKTHSRISITLHPTTQIANIDQGEADIAIRFSSKTPQAHYCELLLKDEWFPVAAPRYLQQLGHGSLCELFERADLLTHSRQPWQPWMQAAGIPVSAIQRNITYSDTGFLLDAALNLQGIALGRRSLVQRLLQDGSLVRISDVAIPSAQSYFLLASERAMLSRYGETVIQWIRSIAASG
ncbi:LysR family transcriptional regulator [Comamonadaceae bacterium OH3737_COT-264]|nr:LysR family transcriptional regulator [Comamonadaceae bacterium OH3737_COT-264]